MLFLRCAYRQSFKVVISGAFLLLFSGSFSAHAMTLKEALVTAFEQSHLIRAEEAQVRNANENAPQALSEWLPTIEGQYSRGHSDLEFGSSNSDGDTERKSISLRQPLFNGGGTVARMRQADHRINAAEARLKQVEQEVLLEAATVYLDVVRDMELLEINKHNEQVLAKHLAASKERFKLGEDTKTDVAQSEARYALAVSQLTIAEGTLAGSRAAFKRAIGVEPVAANLPETQLALPPLVLQKLLTDAQMNHPSIMASKQDLQDAERTISIEKSGLLPSVSFNASHTDEESVFAFASGTSESTTQTYSVDVSVPLYQAGAQYSRVRQAKHAVEKLKEDYEQQQETVRENVIRRFHALQAAKASILSTQSAVEAADIALDGVKKEAKAGARTTLDVLDAEQELFDARQELVSARRDAIVESYGLLESIGKLSATSLGLEVKRSFDPARYRDASRYQIIGF